MRISDEIDALEVMSVPSMIYLVSARLVGMVVALIPLYLVALFTSFLGTRLVTTSIYGMSPGLYDYYFHLYLPPIDILYSLIKVTVFAIEVSLIHTSFGYYASGGPAGVGRAGGIAFHRTILAVVHTTPLLSFLGTLLVTTSIYGMSPGLYDYYFHLYLPPIDILYSLIKVTVFAIEVSLIHSYFGYYASGGPAGVGRAVGIAIRSTIIVVVLTNLLLSFLFWGGAPTVSLTG